MYFFPVFHLWLYGIILLIFSTGDIGLAIARTQIAQPLIIQLSNLGVDPVGISVSCATHTQNGLAGLVPLGLYIDCLNFMNI